MGAPKSQGMINQNQSYIYGQGGALENQDVANAQTSRNNAMGDRNDLNAQYNDVLWNGGGGYNPDEAAAIKDTSGLQALKTSDAALQSNYLTPDEQSGILGNQSGIKNAEGNVTAAVDPTKLVQSQDFVNNYRMTPEQQQQMTTAAARDASTVDQAAISRNEEAARANGSDPLGVAGYTQAASRAARIDAGNAAANARVGAASEAAAREQQLEQMRVGDNQTAAQLGLAAGQTNLGAEQNMEANASNRNAGIAANRQATGESNQATQYNQGQYIEGQQAGRAAGVADTRLSDLNNARNYLQGNQAMDTNTANTQDALAAGVYGTTTGAANQNTANQVQADSRPKWWEQLISAGAQVGAAEAGKPPSDVRLKENIRLITTVKGVGIYTYNFIGDPTPCVGVLAQQAYSRFPEDIVVGGRDAATEPWRVSYDTLVPKLMAA